MPKAPRNYQRSFQNRTNGLFKKATELHELMHEVRISIVVEKSGSRPLVWKSGKEVMALLLEQRGDEVKITEEVVRAAAGNWKSGKEVMALLHNIINLLSLHGISGRRICKRLDRICREVDEHLDQSSREDGRPAPAMTLRRRP
ncbi:hypothetical protein DM02DRAFT_669919 [Periconia macrospinosa]|uniref:MADS-box domain-containing protein n=1 Tax=Periconia macrospinosa TaxID=97972 RepID=A0A2V1DY33_9PLEO|nr:hypothetical protein DM02DRAFT_669919 [Periconia macrospinosa]